MENTQLLVFNTTTNSFLGLQSHMKFTDFFQTAAVVKWVNQQEHEGDLYCWSIYGALHKMGMKDFQWTVVEDLPEMEQQP